MRFRTRKGFTLIELVAVLVLLGMTIVFANHLIAVSTNAYLLGFNASAQAQRATTAHQRIIKELNWADPATITLNSATSLSWTSAHPARSAEGTQTLNFDSSAGTVLLNGTILLDNVSQFNLAVGSGSSVQLTLNNWNATLYPRITGD